VESHRTGLLVTVQLVQHRPIDGYPDSEQAQAVGRILVSAGRRAAGDRTEIPAR
jgi:hypothetical protein